MKTLITILIFLSLSSLAYSADTLGYTVISGGAYDRTMDSKIRVDSVEAVASAFDSMFVALEWVGTEVVVAGGIWLFSDSSLVDSTAWLTITDDSTGWFALGFVEKPTLSAGTAYFTGLVYISSSGLTTCDIYRVATGDAYWYDNNATGVPDPAPVMDERVNDDHVLLYIVSYGAAVETKPYFPGVK